MGTARDNLDVSYEEALVEEFARRFEVKPLLSLEGHSLSIRAKELVPLEKALQFMLFPCDIGTESISLVTCAPAGNRLFEALARITSPRFKPYVSTFSIVMTVITSIYGLQSNAASMAGWRRPRPNISPIPEAVERAVTRHLSLSGRILGLVKGRFQLAEGSGKAQGREILNAAWLLDAISVTRDGSISLCGERVAFGYDARRVRRRIEDTIRKTADSNDILQLALQLGVNIV
jgi:hypothetical protein